MVMGTIRGMYVYNGFEIICREYAGTFLECEDSNGNIVEIDVNEEIKGWLGDYLEFLDDAEDLLKMDWDVVVNYMDNEIREELHKELSPCGNERFLQRYMEMHHSKYNEEFQIN